MSGSKRLMIRNVLVAVGAIILIPAALVARLTISPIGVYATGLALIGGGIAILGAYIGKGQK